MKNYQVLEAVETLSQLSQVSDKVHPELIPQPDRIKKSFSILSAYLTSLYTTHAMLLKNKDYLASLKAVMVIAEEAHAKLNVVAKLFNRAVEEVGEKEYQDLFDFYLKKINDKVEHVAGEVFRYAEAEKERAETDTHGIRNLEAIRKDSDYELFYIRDEEGLQHFSKNLLRHAQLLGTFDELVMSYEGEDPFIRLHFVDDRMLQKRALAVRSEMASRIDYFLKEGFKYKKIPIVGTGSKAVMALFLASYPSLVLQNEPDKACFEYFSDFQKFLAELITKPDFYKKASSFDALSDKGIYAAQHLTLGLITSLYSTKNESIYVAEHLYQFVPRPHLENFSPFSFFDRLLDYDKSLRAFLSGFPSGPLMKALDFVREENKPHDFAPLRQMLPQQLCSFKANETPVALITLGSPTIQTTVASADIDPLFHPFITSLSGQKTLIIDLEDRHEVSAEARVEAVFGLEAPSLEKANLPRLGLFYNQGAEYSFYNLADEFIKSFLDQMDEGGSYQFCGLGKRELKAILSFVHTHLFESKKDLSLKERLVFIELAHSFMGLKLIEEKNPETVLIICKDGIDQANPFALSLYAIVRLLNHEKLLENKTFDFFIGELYGPAMLKRNRAIFEESIVRMYGALSHLYAHITRDATLVKKIHDFFPIFKTLRVESN